MMLVSHFYLTVLGYSNLGLVDNMTWKRWKH